MSKRQNNINLTSEVGSNQPPTGMQEMFRQFFSEQSNCLVEMMRSLNQPPSVRNNISLPKFNADLPDADAESWCSMVELIFAEKPLDGTALISALSCAMVGDASQWLTQICFPGITWQAFKDVFLQRFSNLETSAASVMSWLNSRPRPGENISAYGNRLVNALESKWKAMSIEKIAVSVALAHMSRIDHRLQRLACTTELNTRSDLQHELKAFSYVEPDKTVAVMPSKRMKFATLKCHYCGKEGHKIAECRVRKEQQKDNHRITTPSTSVAKEKKKIVCFKCGEAGHIASMCSKSTVPAQQEKGIYVCELVKPKGVLTHSGKSFEFYFDSGAECSLIEETTARQFTGKRFNTLAALKGIGDAIIYSSIQILTVVTINDLSLEVLFYVVVDNALKYKVVLGREVLAMGFGVVTTPNNFKVFKLNSAENSDAHIAQVDLHKFDFDLQHEDRLKLIFILHKYLDFFITGIPNKRVTCGHLEIRLIDNTKTVQRRPYKLSIEEKEIVREKIKELIEAKIIRPSSSPFASPMLLVKKKNGTDRLCVDYRELNANTVADKFPLPLISDQIARLRGANYFSRLDMASGFHQIQVHPNSIELTAFVTPDGQYEYLAMPFGLKNAPSVFQRAILLALGDLAYSFVVVYMDDIMIVASTKEEAFERLSIVLEVLSNAGFSFNLEKCAFLQTKVEYLGYVIQSGEIGPNPQKISALTTLTPPETITQLRQFIGLASYFRQFVPKFAQTMKPLYQLTSGKNLVWKAEHEQIRAHIISVLTSYPVLTIFDPQYEIELHTDASSLGYGAILLHKIDSKPHPVEYYSKTTNSAESKYASYELETLAVVNSVKYFKHYLLGRKFTIFTDCNSLKASQNKKDLTPRAQRWWAFLQSFNFDIQYREGKRMAHVDFLSRNPMPVNNFNKIKQKNVNLVEITKDWLQAEQERDLEISSIVIKLRNQELSSDIANTYDLRNGILYRKIQRKAKTEWLPVVPRAFRWSVVNHVHESVMHLGWEKTLNKLYRYYWFDKMSKYVRKFVNNCMTCRLSKSTSGKVQSELHPIPKVSIPWHTVHIDITGKLSGKSDIKEYVIVLIDAFTKFVFLHHTVNIDAESCIKAAKRSISFLGVPSRIIADQGRCFAGKQFRDFCASQNINLHLIATGASRANGQVERVMSTLKNLFTMVESSSRSWQDALEEIQLALNCTTNSTTKISPLELLIGKEVRPFGLLASNVDHKTNLDEVRKQAEQNIQKSACYEKLRYDKSRASVDKFKIGDFVLLKNEERHHTKLDPKFRGPFKIINVLDGDRYEIKSLSSKRTYKYAHEFLRRLPEGIPNEDDILCEDENRSENANVENKSVDADKEMNNVTRGSTVLQTDSQTQVSTYK